MPTRPLSCSCGASAELGHSIVVQAVVRALSDGAESVLADPHPAIREIARAGGADGELVRAQLKAVAPILRPPLRVNRDVLERWADFDGRFGILRHWPNVDRPFASI